MMYTSIRTFGTAVPVHLPWNKNHSQERIRKRNALPHLRPPLAQATLPAIVAVAAKVDRIVVVVAIVIVVVVAATTTEEPTSVPLTNATTIPIPTVEDETKKETGGESLSAEPPMDEDDWKEAKAFKKAVQGEDNDENEEDEFVGPMPLVDGE
eukprot:scaffold173603_cov35-Attheya_sp.AAC.1